MLFFFYIQFIFFQFGVDALLSAVATGNVEFARLLVKYGADENAANKVCQTFCLLFFIILTIWGVLKQDGNTPMCEAARLGDLAMVKVLLSSNTSRTSDQMKVGSL